MPSPEIPAPESQSGEKKGFFARLREGLHHPNEASQVAELERARAEQEALRLQRQETRAEDLKVVSEKLQDTERPVAPAADLVAARAKLEAMPSAQASPEQPAVEQRDAA